MRSLWMLRLENSLRWLGSHQTRSQHGLLVRPSVSPLRWSNGIIKGCVYAPNAKRGLYGYGGENNRTVYALSTPPGKSAIAVVRITGPLCAHIHKTLCPSKLLPKPRTATLRTLFHPTTTEVLDPSALLLYFPGPNSFTGEDILELHLHGGPAVLKSVLSALPKCSPSLTSSAPDTQQNLILPAEPGEFTRRAFYNSRLSLPQIEALSDLLSAETESQRQLSIQSTTKGADNLSEAYHKWHQSLVAARGELEALIDFSEDQQFEETPQLLLKNVKGEIVRLRAQMDIYLSNAVKGELLRNGINLALIGSPNVGKSSLLNKIVGRDAAIVSAKAGTTRDIVDVSVDMGGWMVVLGDTAGFRNGVFGGDIDEIEIEGMKRARKRVEGADVVVFVVSVEEVNEDSGFELDHPSLKEAIEVAQEALNNGKEVVVAVNKIDKLKSSEALENVFDLVTRGLTGLKEGRVVGISCTGEGYEGTIQKLMGTLTGMFKDMTSVEDGLEGTPRTVWSEAIGASSRQRILVEECYRYLGDFLLGLEDSQAASEYGELEDDIDIVLKAETLRRAAGCMSRIMGKGEGASTVDEVLGVVFEKFCVGK
ncbi:mitochondrial splicing system protein [Orbilia blumenaviensis]|uniref:Mitochondrial splicing system protein n=1 Tax=Orbilia blumenaviensis TaxID=1796055 RepID=A0AAV9V2T3_9PEZI